MGDDQFYTCSCFYTHNYYAPGLNRHVQFYNKDQFIADYGQLFSENYHNLQIEDVIRKIECEKQRRENLAPESLKRKEIIREKYNPLIPDIYNLQETYLDPKFLQLVKLAKSPVVTKEELLKSLTPVKDADQVYALPVFTEKFCHDFVTELKHFEESDLPKGRPNTMNNDGILLDELGFDEKFLTPFREQYIQPIASILFPENVCDSLDSHKAFIVKYKVDRDVDLDFHYDNAEVTVNVSLSGDFEEGSLYFGNMREEPPAQRYAQYVHKVTHGLIHRGQHMHGALPITEGERYNLIIWMRSSGVRNQKCPMCDLKPDLVRTVGRGDGFTSPQVDVCHLT